MIRKCLNLDGVTSQFITGGHHPVWLCMGFSLDDHTQPARSFFFNQKRHISVSLCAYPIRNDVYNCIYNICIHCNIIYIYIYCNIIIYIYIYIVIFQPSLSNLLSEYVGLVIIIIIIYIYNHVFQQRRPFCVAATRADCEVDRSEVQFQGFQGSESGASGKQT